MQALGVFGGIGSLAPQLYSEVSSPLLQSSFTLASRNVLLLLSDHCVFLCENALGGAVTQYALHSFSLKFEVLTDKNNSGLGVGLKFELERKEGWESIEFMCEDPSVLHFWERELRKKINQRNFHGLFKAKRKIGKGAFATVYLAQRLQDGRMFAVKAFSKERQYNLQKGKQSLQNQISILREVDHTNLMKLEGVFETQNSIYFIQQYVEGKSLGEWFKKKHHFSTGQVQRIMHDLLNGLSHLSEKRILHRDLKPENLLLADQLVICDFGLSTRANQKNYLFVRCGTPGFVAPQIINITDMSSKSDPISDVFSAGIIFHLLLFNRSVFPGEDYKDILKQNRESAFSLKSDLYGCLSKTCLDLLTKMLERDPLKRISARDALNHKYFASFMAVQQPQKKYYSTDREILGQIQMESSGVYCK